MRTRPASVDEYMAQFPPPVQKRLASLRAIVKRAAPKADESISYGMPAFKHQGPLVYFAAYENHIGLYALPSTQAVFKKELSVYKTGKGSIQFPHDRPLPVALIRKIILFRVKENEQKALARAQKKK